MDFTFRTIHKQQQQHPHFSDHPIIDDLEKQRIRYEILRELEKEKIRNEILAEELERRRVLEYEVRRELGLVMGQRMLTDRYRFEPEMLPQGGPFLFESRRVPLPVPERYDVPVQVQRSTIKSIVVKQTNEEKQEMIGLGHPSSSKRKAPAPSKKGDFSCGVCKIVAPSARGLEEHLSGKKHLAKIGMKPGSKKMKKKGRKKGKKH
ncbi:putative transcription factor C2H2 family [Helianthus annuus]|nr:putative transcription factor C2H2 family [Helianthus annuus]